MSQSKPASGQEIKISEKTIKKIILPPDFEVVLLNDDFTPMEFVKHVLVGIFHHTYEKAEILTFKIHNEGSAVAGKYRKNIAETKIEQLNVYAESEGHPLKGEIRPFVSSK
jgi:ATP-dependent Clp protease adaptor protein ClpS